MISYFGDFAEDDTVNIPFNTFDSNDPSASVTITNLADSDIHVHKDGSITQATTDGATVVINFDGITGNHMITIDTSADAYYATGSEYSVRIEGTTVDGATINSWVGAFSIERAGGVLAVVKALNNFDPANDDVAVVTLVGTTTTNTDMVGTDSAATAANLALAQTDLDTLTAGVTLAAGAITDASLAGNMEIVFETDFATNYNTTRDAWVTNGTDFIGTGWNLGKTGYALTTADWNVGKTGYSVSSTGLDAVLEDSTFLTALEAQVWDAVLTGASHNDATSAGRRLRQLDLAFIILEGTAAAGGTATITLDSNANAVTDNIYRGDRVQITAGTGGGEHGIVISYDASTKIATMSEDWVITPSTDSEYLLTPADVDMETWNHTKVTGDGDWAELQTDVDTLITQIGTAGAGLTDLDGMSDDMKAEIRVEVNAALDTAIPELGVAAPSATPTLRTGQMLLYMALRNKHEVTATRNRIFNNAGTQITESVISDDATTFTDNEFA